MIKILSIVIGHALTVLDTPELS